MPAKGGRKYRFREAASLPHRRLNAACVHIAQYNHWSLLKPSKDGLIAKLLLKEIVFSSLGARECQKNNLSLITNRI